MADKERKITPVSELGEFGLIEKLTAGFDTVNASTLKGVGDDAAVLDFGGKLIVVTTDLLTEGVHFNLMYVPMKHLGYKAAVVNISDVVAMNATPRQLTVSLAISSKFSVENLEELYEGI
ncbi:MAG: thiamine-phosphate kinase, partial [Prolixibacteraceae bacterium]|nr:thiamine-phosphate kinase [Prolixibacteraceae bacterium]